LGPSKQIGQQNAAEQALQYYKSNPKKRWQQSK
jgi:hypothetical protein